MTTPLPNIPDMVSRYECAPDPGGLENSSDVYPISHNNAIFDLRDTFGTNDLEGQRYTPTVLGPGSYWPVGTEYNKDVEGGAIAFYDAWSSSLGGDQGARVGGQGGWTPVGSTQVIHFRLQQDALQYICVVDCGGANDLMLWQDGAAGDVRWGTAANNTVVMAYDTDDHIVTLVHNGDGTSYVRLDGVKLPDANVGTAGSVAHHWLGCSQTFTDFAEMFFTAWFIYDRALTPDECWELENYINTKYDIGIALPGKPAIPLPPVPGFPTLDIGSSAVLGYWDTSIQSTVRDSGDDVCGEGDTVTTWHDLQQNEPPFASEYPNMVGSATFHLGGPNGKGYIRIAAGESMGYNSFPAGGWFGDDHTLIVVGRVYSKAGAGTKILAEISHNGASAEQLVEATGTPSFEYGVSGSTDTVGLIDTDWHIWTLRTRAGTANSRSKYDGSQGSVNMPYNNGAVTGATTSAIQIGDASNASLCDIVAVVLVSGTMEWEDEMRLEHYFNQKFRLGHGNISDPDVPVADLPSPGDLYTDQIGGHYFLRARSQNWPGCATPTDTNDGRDPLGFGLVNATYDHTGNGEGERHLSLAGAFTNYEHVNNDRIYLSGTGIGNGLYYIAEKVDSDAILLVENDGLTGDVVAGVASSTGPFRGAQKMADTVPTGWIGMWCQDVWGRGNKNTDFDTNSGTESEPIIHRGCSARGHNDGTRCVMTLYGAAATDDCFEDNSVALTHVWFENFIFDGANDTNSRFGFYQTASGTNLIRWTNCRFCNGLQSGLYQTSGTGVHMFVNCEIDHCENSGIDGVSADGVYHLTNCDIHHNGTDSNWGYGIRVPFEVHAINCRFYYNRNSGLGLHDQARLNLVGCIFAKNGKASFSPAGDWYGLILYGTNDMVWGHIEGCIFYDNDAGGINIGGASGALMNCYLGQNWFYETGYNLYNGTAEVYAASHNLYDPAGAGLRQSGAHQVAPILDIDPEFIDDTEDNCDFRLKRSSPVYQYMHGTDIWRAPEDTYNRLRDEGGRDAYSAGFGQEPYRDNGPTVDSVRNKAPWIYSPAATQAKHDRFGNAIWSTKERR
jgi:hypothetical protein